MDPYVSRLRSLVTIFLAFIVITSGIIAIVLIYDLFEDSIWYPDKTLVGVSGSDIYDGTETDLTGDFAAYGVVYIIPGLIGLAAGFFRKRNLFIGHIIFANVCLLIGGCLFFIYDLIGNFEAVRNLSVICDTVNIAAVCDHYDRVIIRGNVCFIFIVIGWFVMLFNMIHTCSLFCIERDSFDTKVPLTSQTKTKYIRDPQQVDPSHPSHGWLSDSHKSQNVVNLHTSQKSQFQMVHPAPVEYSLPVKNRSLTKSYVSPMEYALQRNHGSASRLTKSYNSRSLYPVHELDVPSEKPEVYYLKNSPGEWTYYVDDSPMPYYVTGTAANGNYNKY